MLMALVGWGVTVERAQLPRVLALWAANSSSVPMFG
jgi:hypothetical protein